MISNQQISLKNQILKIERVMIMVILLGLAFFNPVFAESNLPSQSGTSKQLNTNSVVKRVLENGLIVLIKPIQANEVITVQVLLKMGREYEPQTQLGISVLMQRLIVWGTINRNDDIYGRMEATGSYISSNNGQVKLNTNLIGFDDSFAYLLDVLRYASLPEAGVIKEKKLLLQQLSAANDQPSNFVYNSFYQLYYGDHPNGFPPNELAKTVSTLTQENLGAWYNKIYIPNNMVISIVGNVNPDTIIRTIQASLGKLPKGDLPVKSATPLPKITENREVVNQKATKTLFFVLGYPAPDLKNNDSPVMDVLNQILGGGSASRLFSELRDKKSLAYSLKSSYFKTTENSYILTFMATAPGNFQAAKEGVIQEFKKLTEIQVTEVELAAAKRGVKGSYLMAHETNSGQGYILGNLELNEIGYQYDDLYPELIDKVTAADIQRVAKKYFQYFTLCVVSPEEIK